MPISNVSAVRCATFSPDCERRGIRTQSLPETDPPPGWVPANVVAATGRRYGSAMSLDANTGGSEEPNHASRGDLSFGLIAASTAMVVGVLWDVSWDGSVGADSFWSPPHMATNFGAAVAGAVGLLLLPRRGRRRSRASVGTAVGAGMALWGALAMLGFLILESWWGQAYGVFGERWNPPEIVFTAAATAVLSGTAVSVAASGAGALAVGWVLGLMLAFAVAATTPLGLANLHRTATFWLVACCLYPAILTWAARLRKGTGATIAASCYGLLVCALIWILPRFGARPVIGPVYEPVEAFLPPSFPLLLVVPALAIDAIVGRVKSEWMAAFVCGAAFLLVFLPVQWWFASFLLSPASDNWFFAGGGRHWPFYVQIGPERSMFWGLEHDPVSFVTLVLGLLAAVISARTGLWLGQIIEGCRQ